MEKDGNTLITFTNDCCEYTCTKDQVIDYIFQPTILAFVDKICEFVDNQDRIPQKVVIDSIFIVKRQEQTTYLKRMIVNSLSDCLKDRLAVMFGPQCNVQACSSSTDPQDLQIESSYRPVVRVRENIDKDYIKHFLQINIQRDCFHLNLHEATSISGDNERTYQNVRKLRTSTFEFDLISALVKHLYNYVCQNPHNYTCQTPAHKRRTQKYDDALRKGLLYYLKVCKPGHIYKKRPL